MQKQKSKEFLRLCKKYGVDPDNVAEVLSFEEACKITGDNPKKLPIVSGIAVRHRKRQLADYKLSIIADALKTDLSGKRPVRKDVDYTNTDQWKYYPVFTVKADKKKSSGSGLAYYFYVSRGTSYPTVGVRLSFPNSDTARFFGMHFLKLHIDHQLYT